MAVCVVNDLLADGKCFVALPPHVVNAIIAQLWCQISEAITPIPPGQEGGLWNPEQPGPIDNVETGEPIVNPEA